MKDMPDAGGNVSPIQILEQRLGFQWLSIAKAKEDSKAKQAALEGLLAEAGSPDTSVVVFGSVARTEVTSGSDIDWILLVDGQSVPEHKTQEDTISRKLVDGKFIQPGSSGIFGTLVGSHDLVHRIGGEDDLNSNTTRRILLLLESLAIGNHEAFDRVRRQVLRRYLEDDRGLTHSSGEVRIPRFLLNDLTRYWRTVTVDFVYKQRAQESRKWAIRNLKLRMSRKLIFASGLALVFACHLDLLAEDARTELRRSNSCASMITYLDEQLRQSPLERLASLCLSLDIGKETILSLFGSYDRYLAILDSPEKRSELEDLHPDDLASSPIWDDVRTISRDFHEGLVALFLKDNRGLSDLAMRYGIF